VRVRRGEQERAIADLRRAVEINPNSANAFSLLAFAEAAVGLREETKEHGSVAIRLSPRDFWVTGNAQLALAMASYCEREYAEAARWAELAMQSAPRTGPIRHALMIACCARKGDYRRATQEREVLDSFAPDFIPSLFRGDNQVFTRPDDMENLLSGLKLAMSMPE
jgi:Flp pilus assembly protein TadD